MSWVRLSLPRAKAICCRAWAITPREFDRMTSDGQVCLSDVFRQVCLEITDDPQEFFFPGTRAKQKQEHLDAENAAAFQAMWRAAEAAEQRKQTTIINNLKDRDS